MFSSPRVSAQLCVTLWASYHAVKPVIHFQLLHVCVYHKPRLEDIDSLFPSLFRLASLQVFMAEYHGWQSASWSNTSRQHDQFSCKTSFELPFPSQKLFLLARGPVGGSAKIIQSPTYRPSASGQDEGVVTVEVAARYWHVSDLDFIRVSRISRHADENGVGIFVSSSLN